MIEVIGEDGSAEHEVGLMLASAFAKLWPGIETSPVNEEAIKIAAGVKLSGQKISDIDVVVVGSLRTRRHIVAKAGSSDSYGNSITGAKIRVRSFVIAVEVKDHSGDRISCEAGGVKVYYANGWKDATSQNEDQKYALRNYLRDMTGTEAWVQRCLVLRGIQELPKHRGIQQPVAGAVAATFDAATFLLATANVGGVQKQGGEYVISSSNEEVMEAILSDGLLKQLRPSNLDRRRMDRIAARPVEARELAAMLGTKRIHLRGNGGTGKTVLLLQSAYEAFLERGARTLVLTYNTALAADIQRTLALMGISGGGEAGGITVRTVMSFMYAWLEQLGLSIDEGISFENYEAKCAEARRYLAEGAVTFSDVASIKEKGSQEFSFDGIIVDEAQDWPADEAGLLTDLYGAELIALADGLSQLIRGSATDWKSPKDGEFAGGMKSLREGLRMKASLCRFANAVADEAGFQWHVTPNKQAAGGRVIVMYGDYSRQGHLQRSLLSSAIQDGNLPIDMLHCVPPSSIEASNGRRGSKLAAAFARQGWESWDGVDDVVRKSFPRSAGELRIVQYESCRGLEGWTVVLDGLDEFWDRKREEALKESSYPAEAESVAWRWCMIPMTRPIDTLVITIRNKESMLARVLAKVSSKMPDTVEQYQEV